MGEKRNAYRIFAWKARRRERERETIRETKT
jgi:hypothetical protein